MAYITVQKMNTADSQEQVSYTLWAVLLLGLFLAETILYRLARKKIKKTSYVWLHISSVMFDFVVLPGLMVILKLAPGSRINLMTNRLLGQVWPVLFWASFIIGHAFFVAAIAKSFAKRKTADGNEAATEVLDGILDEE